MRLVIIVIIKNTITIIKLKNNVGGYMKVEQLATYYLEGYAKPHKKTWKEKDQYYLNRWIVPTFGHRDVDSIKRGEVEVFHKSFHSKTVANQVIIVMSSMFNRGIDWEFCTTNPASRIKKFKEKPRTKYIPLSERKNFLDALVAVGSKSFVALIKFQLATGCRKKEALNLKWQNVSKELRTITFEETKNGRTHILPLTKSIERILNSVPVTGEYVFYGEYRKDIRKELRKLKKEYGDENLRLGNDLRRTAASYMLQAGANRSLVGEILNQVDERSTRIYTYFETKNKEEGLNLLPE